MINQYPNVYGDFSGDIFDYELIENLVKAVSPDKILYGSDYSMFDPRANLFHVLFADVSDEIKLKILRENAMKVYKLGE